MRDKHYGPIMITAFFTSLGSSMYFIAVAWILYETTKDATYTGLMVGFGFLPGVVLNLFFGILVDRMNRKRLTVHSLGTVTLSMVLLFGAMLLHLVRPWMIILVHMLVQTFSSLFRTAQQAFVTDICEKQEIPRMYSGMGASTSVGGLIGTSVGGVALTFLPAESVMLVVCLSFLFSVWCTLAVPEAKERVQARVSTALSAAAVWHDLADNVRYLNRNPLMYSLFSIMFVGQLVVHTSAGMLSVYTSSYLKGTSTLYGVLESATSIGAIVAGLTATWYLYKSRRFVSTGALALTAIGLGLLAVTRHPVAAFVAIFLVGTGTTWLRVLMQSVQQVATEPAYYGRMAACRQMVNQSAVAVGGPILGVIAEKAGVNVSYAALLVPVGLSLLVTLRFAGHPLFGAIIESIVPGAKSSAVRESVVQ